jgi:hypothetical protein
MENTSNQKENITNLTYDIMSFDIEIMATVLFNIIDTGSNDELFHWIRLNKRNEYFETLIKSWTNRRSQTAINRAASKKRYDMVYMLLRCGNSTNDIISKKVKLYIKNKKTNLRNKYNKAQIRWKVILYSLIRRTNRNFYLYISKMKPIYES